MNRFPAAAAALPLARLSALALAAVLTTGCSSMDSMFSGDKVDYKTAAAKTKPLEVPPDLTQLARDGRYQPLGGVVSAAATPGATPVAAGTPSVALASKGELRIERQGNSRWLVVPSMTPEQLWPVLKAFWVERGLVIASESAEAGVMETDWAENRAKLPQDVIRTSLGKLFSGLYDSGERDLYRTRIERVGSGSEIYISHRGMEEVTTGDRGEGTKWRARAADPSLEAEMLSRLMVRLGPTETVAKAAVANAAETPAKARAVAGAGNALEVDEPFDRAWRRVGLALDRSGFTIEDRDRAAGLYFVRYIDPKNNGKEDPGFWSRLFGDDTPRGPERYRVTVKAEGTKSVVTVLAGNGASDAGEGGKRIVGRLVSDLR